MVNGCCGPVGEPAACDPSRNPGCDGAARRSPERPAAFARFDAMVANSLCYARDRAAAGDHVVGIMCEYTPREIIMAAGGVPACLCGGSARMAIAGEEDLPANLCPLIKSTYGYHRTGGNPFLELADLVVAETTCDGKKKMYERMAESRPMHVLELPQKPDDADAFAHWLAEVRKLVTALEERFAITVTDAALRSAIATMNRERALRRELAGLMRADAPPLTGRELLDCKTIVSGIPADLDAYAALLRDLAERPSPVAGRDPVRVLMTGVPMAHGAERVLDLIEDSGALVVSLESCSGVKPILEDVDATADDPLAAIAHKYFHLPCSVMTRNDARLDSIRALAREYRADCIIDLVWQACLTYDCESWLVERTARELGVPYLRIETDYTPSDTARIGVRLEALFETVRARSERA
ncbi:MAG: double-cubane-cluster-containing anaerobic reductase [Planctomycetota bacterium]